MLFLLILARNPDVDVLFMLVVLLDHFCFLLIQYHDRIWFLSALLLLVLLFLSILLKMCGIWFLCIWCYKRDALCYFIILKWRSVCIQCARDFGYACHFEHLVWILCVWARYFGFACNVEHSCLNSMCSSLKFRVFLVIFSILVWIQYAQVRDKGFLANLIIIIWILYNLSKKSTVSMII